MVVISAHELTKRFGEVTAVEGLNMEVNEGEVIGFLGPNGAGKTTTIRMLAGIISPTSGYAVVAGQRTDKDVEKLHEAIGLLTESPGFYNRLSAQRNLEYFAGFYSELDIDTQVKKYLGLMGLWERRHDKVGTFSKGMRQRLALARAILHEPPVLFLDEPTAGLDPEVSRDVRELIGELSVKGHTIFLSTHNLAEAEFLCHRIAVIRTRLIALDTPDDLRQRLSHHEVSVKLEAFDIAVLNAINELHFVKHLRQDGDQLLVEIADPRQNRPELVKKIVDAGGRVLTVSEERHSLEDVYLNLVQEEANP
ncbi:MAG: ABC transporter ATP-binding protein [Chloroflexota bacterium]|nr:ABC transporter ATP-binding protein [Chloroflexota bacterium]